MRLTDVLIGRQGKNMNCTDINTHIDDYLDKQLAQQDSLAFEQHIESCEQCRSNLQRAQSMMMGLKDLSIPDPTLNFEQRVFSEVRRQHKETQRYKFAAGFSTAVAASLAIWFTSTLFMPATISQQPQAITVAMNEVQTIRLLFDSKESIQNVSLSIDLPENMELDGYPGRKELVWKTSLKKGQNVLALPVMAVEYGQGELIATLKIGDKVKVLRVELKSVQDGALHYQLKEMTSV